MTGDSIMVDGTAGVVSMAATYGSDHRRPATGSEAALAEVVAPALPTWGKAPTASSSGSGAPDRTRTCDLWVRNPTLYPLSYRRASGQDTR